MVASTGEFEPGSSSVESELVGDTAGGKGDTRILAFCCSCFAWSCSSTDILYGTKNFTSVSGCEGGSNGLRKIEQIFQAARQKFVTKFGRRRFSLRLVARPYGPPWSANRRAVKEKKLLDFDIDVRFRRRYEREKPDVEVFFFFWQLVLKSVVA